MAHDSTQVDIAIVTSCHNYGQYLRDWALSIIRLKTFRPAVVAIADNGSTDTSPHQIEEAADLLREHGLNVITERVPFRNLGDGRNTAVRISGDTKWVCHLDADDMLMPHFLEDVVALWDHADVVGAGYRRTGDLQAGPRNRTRVYSPHQGEGTLRSNAPCSGVSPFRRAFWEQTPYREDMRGGWDTALWIGFAHLNARFVPTRRPVFLYRQHADSVFNQRWPNQRKTHFAGVKLGSLRRGVSGVSVVVPFRPDGAERDRSWQWVQEWYAHHHPEWQVVEGMCPQGQWMKGAAVADALTRATGAALVIADSDCVIDPEALARAVHLVQTRQAEWVVPHHLVHRLDKTHTVRVLSGEHAMPDLSGVTYARKPYEGYAGGGMVVVDRSDYEASGGIPSAFVGWGAEDEALAIILDTLLGPHTRMGHDLVHLWHSPVRRMRHMAYKANKTILGQIMQLADSPDDMWELVSHLAGGGDPDRLPTGRPGGVRMVATVKHQRGRDVVQVGDQFRVTEEEARRYDMRSAKIAVRVTGSALTLARRGSKERTLDIRAEQAERNQRVADRLAMRQQLTQGGEDDGRSP